MKSGGFPTNRGCGGPKRRFHYFCCIRSSAAEERVLIFSACFQIPHSRVSISAIPWPQIVQPRSSLTPDKHHQRRLSGSKQLKRRHFCTTILRASARKIRCLLESSLHASFLLDGWLPASIEITTRLIYSNNRAGDACFLLGFRIRQKKLSHYSSQDHRKTITKSLLLFVGVMIAE